MSSSNEKTPVMALPVDTLEQRIEKALGLIVAYGGFDGAHHKDWVLDQVTRALTGCKPVQKETENRQGIPYSYWEQVDNEAYQTLVANACNGADGPNTYSWETGIAP